jgi:hypothetical protein
MTVSDTLAHKSLSNATRFFFPVFAVQFVIGAMITIGLFHAGFWKTAVLEVCKLTLVLRQALEFRRASLEQGTSARTASLLSMAGIALMATSEFGDVILFSCGMRH